GGKITTYRKLAEHAVNKLCEVFSDAGDAWTKQVPLPGGEFASKQQLTDELNQAFPWLSDKQVQRFVRQYGKLCYVFLQGKSSVSELGQDFGSGMHQAEVDYLIEHEWARTLEDVIWRRTKQGLRLSEAQKANLEQYIVEKVSTMTSQISDSVSDVKAVS
ncbi:MAG TPA: glycerol-3-phosphate dehydrogenase, partial [Alteromonas sp.]|nr:glycerol-3-phosphate dehydrogenase [Alteromonas sp.]